MVALRMQIAAVLAPAACLVVAWVRALPVAQPEVAAEPGRGVLEMEMEVRRAAAPRAAAWGGVLSRVAESRQRVPKSTTRLEFAQLPDLGGS